MSLSLNRFGAAWIWVLAGALAGLLPAGAAGTGSELLMGASAAQAGLRLADLRCEYLSNPLAIDDLRPRLSWRIEASGRGQEQTAFQILVASSPEALAAGRGDLWDSGRVAGSPSTQIAYAGRALSSRQECHWKARVWDGRGRVSAWSASASWTMGLLAPGDWTAQFVSARDLAPLHKDPKSLFLPPARHYRTEFAASRPVRRALLRASALGVCELYVNGQRADESLFTPGWTDYRKRAYYQTWDVTSQLRRGTNVLGAVVADGWYAGYVGYGLLVGYGPNKTGRNIYGKTPAVLAQLEIEYADGAREIIATSPAWKVTDSGPVREADLLMGETYDARREFPAWARAGYNDAAWQQALPAEANGSCTAPFHDGAGVRDMEFGFVRPARLEAYPAPPVRVIEEIKPVAITSPAKGVQIFDLGQNFAGTVRLKVRGPAGTEVRLRYGEMRHPDGRLMTENLRKARATDRYILRGDPAGEVWTPRFTFHGFQFVELSGYPGAPGLDAITGLVLHSDTPLTSRFECSDPMVNRLFKNIVWTQRANFLELPTDCPQRDEREGWMGDAQIYARAATCNADVAAFFSKWLREVDEAQLPSGAYPDYCPWPFQHGKAFATAWTDAGIICPWTVWKAYGDTRVIERHYASMTRFMEWRVGTAGGFLGVERADANTWGDWLNLNEPTPLHYIDTLYYAHTARLMAEMAQAIGRDADATAYRQLFGSIKTAFAGKYLKPDGSLTVDTQTACALALTMDVLPEASRPIVGARLAERIRANQTRMATGFLGTRPLLPALSAAGFNDLAAQLLQSRRFPSWGFEVDNGATTIWERWDSYTKQDGFGKHNAAMNSYAHYSFGAVCEWMFQTLAGIDSATPGGQQVIIRPMPPAPGSNPEHKAIDWVKASTASHYGPVSTEWRRKGSRFQLQVELPPNTTGTVFIPALNAAGATEGGRPLARATGVRVLREEAGRVVVAVGSGRYVFESEVKP